MTPTTLTTYLLLSGKAFNQLDWCLIGFFFGVIIWHWLFFLFVSLHTTKWSKKRIHTLYREFTLFITIIIAKQIS